MNRRTLFSTLHQITSQKGKSLARKAGNSALERVSKRLQAKGYSKSVPDIDTLTAELKRMHREGQFNADQWKRVRRELAELWKKRS